MSRELLFSVTKKDFEIQTFRSGGKGGQNQNKRDTGVRIIHHDSGARGESRQHRTQLQNKKSAFRHLVQSPKFKSWLRVQTAFIVDDLKRRVDAEMELHNLLIEVRRDGKWVKLL